MSDTEVNEKWNTLFHGLVRNAQITDPDFVEIAKLNSLLGSVGLVQPFNWRAWGAATPEQHEVWQLNIYECIQHITRLVRAERTYEGVLYSALRSGLLPALCLVAFQRTEGKRAPVLGEVVKI